MTREEARVLPHRWHDLKDEQQQNTVGFFPAVRENINTPLGLKVFVLFCCHFLNNKKKITYLYNLYLFYLTMLNNMFCVSNLVLSCQMNTESKIIGKA